MNDIRAALLELQTLDDEIRAAEFDGVDPPTMIVVFRPCASTARGANPAPITASATRLYALPDSSPLMICWSRSTAPSRYPSQRGTTSGLP